MIGYTRPDSMSFRLCVYFARNPDEELSTQDIRAKFGIRGLRICEQLRKAVANRLLELAEERAGKAYVYRAGPALLEMIGEKR